MDNPLLMYLHDTEYDMKIKSTIHSIVSKSYSWWARLINFPIICLSATVGIVSSIQFDNSATITTAIGFTITTICVIRDKLSWGEISEKHLSLSDNYAKKHRKIKYFLAKNEYEVTVLKEFCDEVETEINAIYETELEYPSRCEKQAKLLLKTDKDVDTKYFLSQSSRMENKYNDKQLKQLSLTSTFQLRNLVKFYLQHEKHLRNLQENDIGSGSSFSKYQNLNIDIMDRGTLMNLILLDVNLSYDFILNYLLLSTEKEYSKKPVENIPLRPTSELALDRFRNDSGNFVDSGDGRSRNFPAKIAAPSVADSSEAFRNRPLSIPNTPLARTTTLDKLREISDSSERRRRERRSSMNAMSSSIKSQCRPEVEKIEVKIDSKGRFRNATGESATELPDSFQNRPKPLMIEYSVVPECPVEQVETHVTGDLELEMVAVSPLKIQQELPDISKISMSNYSYDDYDNDNIEKNDKSTQYNYDDDRFRSSPNESEIVLAEKSLPESDSFRNQSNVNESESKVENKISPILNSEIGVGRFQNATGESATELPDSFRNRPLSKPVPEFINNSTKNKTLINTELLEKKIETECLKKNSRQYERKKKNSGYREKNWGQL
jgi:hypothetical protein